MAGQLLFIVAVVAVAHINALPGPTVSMVPFKTYPSLVPYIQPGFTIDPRDTAVIKSRPLRQNGTPIQPRNPPIQPRDTVNMKSRPLRNPPIQPRNPPIQPREPGFKLQPKDTISIKTRPLRLTYTADYTLQCKKKKQVARVSPGESVQFSTINYPSNYNKKSKCNWQLKGNTDTTRFSIYCDAFELQPANKKGKCLDRLEIDGNKFCGNDYPMYYSTSNIVTMKFIANKKKEYSGFTCTATAYDPTLSTVGPVTTEEPSTGPSTCSCGRVNRASRIVGGVETEVNEYPWMVALAWSQYSSSAFCGGSIISDRWVLTAAHCADVMSNSNVVVVGEHQWSSDSESSATQKVGIEQVIMHPSYSDSTLDNDIALIKLASPLTFDANNNVAPVCPPDANDLYENVDALVTGWGTLSSGGSQPDSLQEVMVPTMSNSDCQSGYGSSITDNMICAGYDAGGKDSCQGDSGGPMVTADGSIYRQIGVVSWGYGCAYEGYPGVYARVNNYLEWVSDLTGSSWCDAGTTVVTSGPVNTTPEPPVTTAAPVITDLPPGTCSCGRINRSTRIVGGVETEVNEYPWMAALAWSSSSSNAFCGASIINERWILTASHCADVMSLSNVVVVGEHQWSSSSESSVTQMVAIEEIVMHPEYSDSTLNHDVALVKLASTLTFDANNNVAPICPPDANDDYENIDAIVTGWGTLSSGGSQPDSLQEVVVPTMSNSACQSAYGSSITDYMICAGYDAGGKDSCQGDSGGPMITADGSIYRQIGVVSWGYGCAYPGYPGVYARVTSQLAWITSSISGTSWCDAGNVVTSGPVNTTPGPAVTTVEPSTDCNCGRVNRATRIVGGVTTEVNEYPWMVALADSTSSSSAFCGGTIIDENYVLTASHCVSIMSGSEVVVIGEHSWSSSGESSVRETIAIAEVIMHPNYNSATLENDVALLKLATSLTFGNDNKVAPICPPEAGNLYSGVDAIATGWGTTESGGSLSDTLREVTVPTMDNSVCKSNYEVYDYGEGITDDMICAGLPEGGKDACQGDSGGPLIAQDSSSLYRQIGVTSWGFGCAYPGLPGVYARVTSQLSWISSKMSGSGWCSSGSTAVTPAPTAAPVTPTGTCTCGRINRSTRIVGGVETEVNEYPWMVALAWSSSSSSSFCGGSIINKRWILTASHCADIMSTSNVVVVGEHRWSSSSESSVTQKYAIEQILMHPSYSDSTLQNDIALIKLASALTFDANNNVAPICPPDANNLYESVDAIVTGWGTLSSGGSAPDALQEVVVPTMTNSACQSGYGSSITNDMICAGYDAGGKDSCQGDSGGPLITADGSIYRQIGVVSWGYGCAFEGYPGVYSRVTSALEWIKSSISGTSWCDAGTSITSGPINTTPAPTGDCKCGRVNRSTRIINGQETEVLEYPWQAGLVSYSYSRTFCGGSLINSKWVLTAAHCTEGTAPYQIQVLLGEHTIYDTDATERRMDVMTIINHENYITNPWTNGHDISLLELSVNVDFSSTQIRPICLPTTSDLFAGADATVTGWGTTNSGSQSLVLMEVDIPVVTNTDCGYTYGFSYIDDTMICAGEGAGNGACMGDSGGPLITSLGDHHVQIGVVSFGSSNCDALGVYARVTALKSWINSYAMSGSATVCSP